MLGAGTVTVKLTPLLATPPTVTTTFPVVAPVGTGTTMLVALQLVGVAAVPLNFTVLVPCVAPKFAPVIVTDAPTTPDVGFRLVMLGAGTVTVKLVPLLATPPTVTTTFPVVAPVGTGTTMLVALQLVGVAAVPLNVTVLVPCEAPKFAPVIVTLAPTNPDVGFKLVMLGAGTVTVKATPLLATPPTVTTTFPVVAPVGTGATMLVALQFVGRCRRPVELNGAGALRRAEVRACDRHRLAPTNPDVGFKLVMLGAGTVTVKATPVAGHSANRHHHVSRRRSCRYRHNDARGAPARRRCRRPVELNGAGALRRAEVRPCDRHTRTDRPRCRIQARDARCGNRTVKADSVLATPPTVTTTLPVVAPVGTGTTMLVALQLVVVAAVPLNFTVLVPCVAPKFAPVIVTLAPTNPDVAIQARDARCGNRTVKATPVAGHSADRHHHVSRRRSCRYRHNDARGAPARRRCRRPVELHGAGALRRAEVRACDRHTTHRPTLMSDSSS